MRSAFIGMLSDLEESKCTQALKNVYYKQIMDLRTKRQQPVRSNDFDILGFNLLHWAVLCNQPKEEICRLVNTKKINVNLGTTFREGIALYNVTPFHLAVQAGHKELAETLMELGADPTIKRKEHRDLQGAFSGNDYSYDEEIQETTAEFAKRKGSRAFTLFEKQDAKAYHSSRLHDKRDFFSFLPDCVASLFHYSKKQKLDAVTAYETLLNDAAQRESPEWLVKLKQLKDTHPAVDQGKLGDIYRASLKARGM